MIGARGMRGALTFLLVAVLVMAMGLSACGRKGPLERPPASATADGQEVGTDKSGRPDRPFILDRLLR